MFCVTSSLNQIRARNGVAPWPTGSPWPLAEPDCREPSRCIQYAICRRCSSAPARNVLLRNSAPAGTCILRLVGRSVMHACGGRSQSGSLRAMIRVTYCSEHPTSTTPTKISTLSRSVGATGSNGIFFLEFGGFCTSYDGTYFIVGMMERGTAERTGRRSSWKMSWCGQPPLGRRVIHGNGTASRQSQYFSSGFAIQREVRVNNTTGRLWTFQHSPNPPHPILSGASSVLNLYEQDIMMSFAFGIDDRRLATWGPLSSEHIVNLPRAT